MIIRDEGLNDKPVKTSLNRYQQRVKVGTLKEKKKHAFEHVDADALVLWSVSTP